MMRRTLAIALVGSVASLATVAASAWLSTRRAALNSREELAARAAADVGRVMELRSLRERASLRPRPEQDLATRIASTLREIGAPRESMDRLSLESDAPASGSGGDAGGVAFRTQTMRVSLRRLQLVELGRFLSRWRQEQPLWTVVSIGLARSSPAGGGGPSRGDAARVIEVDAPRSDGESATLAVVDERFDVALLLAATYAAEGAQASESGPRR